MQTKPPQLIHKHKNYYVRLRVNWNYAAVLLLFTAGLFGDSKLHLQCPRDQETIMTTPLRNEECTSVSVTPSMLQEDLEVTALGGPCSLWCIWVKYLRGQWNIQRTQCFNGKSDMLRIQLWKAVLRTATIIEKFISTKKATPDRRHFDISGTTPSN